jgi:hypothetical protein
MMAGRHPFARLRAMLSPPARTGVDREADRLRREIDFARSKNERVADALIEHGDSLAEARPVQHWAYFPTDKSRAQFIAFIERRFTGIETHMNSMSRGREHAVTFWHTGVPDSDSMTEVTGMLSLAAESCGGAYDGWETQVLSGSEPEKDSC